jgi:hydroxymethylpyrimidine/phosphomethylpyrimidine kinase
MSHKFPKVCLTIGTSDSSGGAGIQGDLKTFASQECYGASVVVAISAQSFRRHQGHAPRFPSSFVRPSSMRSPSCRSRRSRSGLVPNVAAIRVIGRWLRERPDLPLVLDPVASDSRGIPLLQPEMVAALCEELMPRATISTPNRFEAALLSGLEECLSIEDMQQAAKEIFKRYGAPVVVTGGGLADRTIDVLYGLDGTSHIEAPTYQARQSPWGRLRPLGGHRRRLAKGQALRDSIYHAKHYVSAAIAAAPVLPNGHSTLWHSDQVNVQAVNVGSGGYPILPMS